MEQEQGEELTKYKLDIILAETQKSYYGIIDGLTVEPNGSLKELLVKISELRVGMLSWSKKGRLNGNLKRRR